MRSGMGGRARPMAAQPAAGSRLRRKSCIPISTTACGRNGPDATDFHALQNVDLYNDTNAYYRSGVWGGLRADRLPEAAGWDHH